MSESVEAAAGPAASSSWTELSNLVVASQGGYALAPAGDGTQLTVVNVLEERGVGVLIAGFALRSARKGAEAIKAAIEAP